MKPHQTTPNQTHLNITRPEWFGVICTFFGDKRFFCDLDMICSGMIWCNFIDDLLGRCKFVLMWFDVVWYLDGPCRIGFDLKRSRFYSNNNNLI